jgi:hypothetical protein
VDTTFETIGGPVEDMLKIASGAANREAPHLTVPFYMPLAKSVTVEDALKCCRPDIRQAVKAGTVRLLALAHGQMADDDKPRAVQFVLFFGKLHEDDSDMHYLFDCLEDEIDMAVLMDGDGLRFSEDRALSQEEAVAMWMGGFLGWNDKCPGLYQLRYALIDSATSTEQ